LAVVVQHLCRKPEEIHRASASLDFVPGRIPTFRALGINIAMLSDFHSDSHPTDPGPLWLASPGGWPRKPAPGF
jgi:hypothetical protein